MGAMGKIKLTKPRKSYLAKDSEKPEEALEKALAEVRSERKKRDRALLRADTVVRPA
ncbi:hypothetical protein GCM10027590_37920 [Nocardiopsis nanhaiensis]